MTPLAPSNLFALLPPVDMAAITTGLSAERLRSFGAPDDADALVLARYTWNLQLSAVFTPVLHAIEVTLRNAVDRAGVALHPTVPAHGGVPGWPRRCSRTRWHC